MIIEDFNNVEVNNLVYGGRWGQKLGIVLNDENRFNQSAYESIICTFSTGEKLINPLKYIESLNNTDCNKALIRIIPRINIEKIKKIINEIPNEFNGIKIISDIRKEFYCKYIEYAYEKSLYPSYLKAKKYYKYNLENIGKN